jgi:endonuclease YncB( thermonuclease family)
MPGLLRIRGTIDTAQFWPVGSADADTSKIKVTVGKDSFAFAPDRLHFDTTHAFDDAHVKGTQSGPVIDTKSRITVRLQGIDAPELHYKAPALRRKPPVTDKARAAYNAANRPEKRQWLAESATLALAKKLNGFAKNGMLECVVYSLVDRPFEVIDTYGRFVANVFVGAQFDTDINLWLTQEGWVYPTFYSSMENEEIENLLKAMSKGKKKKSRVWGYYVTDSGNFDPSLHYRKNGAPVPIAQDRGDVVMPKLFRRQVAHYASKQAGLFKGTFASYIKKNPEYCFTLDDFMDAGPHAATPRTLDEFFSGNDFTPEPQELVFREKFSDVVDSKGKRIEGF